MIINIEKLKDIAEIEFEDIVELIIVTDINQLRIFLKEGSFIDIWFSLKLKNRYSFHWERKMVDGTIYRHDNAPHKSWKNLKTFPKHFHSGSEDNVTESTISEKPEEGLREFLEFVRQKIKVNSNYSDGKETPDKGEVKF